MVLLSFIYQQTQFELKLKFLNSHDHYYFCESLQTRFQIIVISKISIVIEIYMFNHISENARIYYSPAL